MDNRPEVDFSDPEWFWPSWKFNRPLDDLFGTLYNEFNTVQLPILEPGAFRQDVLELSSKATTECELYELLVHRREQRICELRKCWSEISTRIAARPSLLEGVGDEAARRWAAFLSFSRLFSFDTLICYFSLFTHDTTSSLSFCSSPEVPSDRSHDAEPSTTSRLSPPSIQSRKRRMSGVKSSGGQENHIEHSPKKRKLQVHRQTYSERVNGGRLTELNESGATKGLSSKASPASADMSVKPECRRSSRIAMQSQELMRAQNAKLRIRQPPKRQPSKPLDDSRHRPAFTATTRAKSRRSR